MRNGADRRPGAVPPAPDDVDDVADADGHAVAADVRGGVDTDRDGLPDTLVDTDGADLLVLTDLDGDALADRVLRIGADGAVHREHPPAGLTAGPGTVGGADPGGDGSPGAASRGPGWWDGLLGALFGTGR